MDPRLQSPGTLTQGTSGGTRRGSRVPLTTTRTRSEETGLVRFGTRMKSLRRRLGAFAFTALALLTIAGVI